MDFIERLLGFSPDGGSGASEAMLIAVPVLALYLAWRAGRRLWVLAKVGHKETIGSRRARRQA